MRRGARAVEVSPPSSGEFWLPGADFADAFQIQASTAMTAPAAARRMMTDPPRWVGALMALRNLLMRPFGVKTSRDAARSGRPLIGWFPVVDAADDRVVLGFDDHHLDFRILLEVAPGESGTLATIATYVRTHGLLGRGYLTVIKPFHRFIVRRLLERLSN